MFAKSDQISEATTLLLGITGLAIVCYDDGLGFGWALLFCALALLFWRSLQSGVVSSRFLFFRFPWTVAREESPTAYWIGMAIEGLFVLGAFIIMLITL